MSQTTRKRPKQKTLVQEVLQRYHGRREEFDPTIALIPRLHERFLKRLETWEASGRPSRRQGCTYVQRHYECTYEEFDS